MFSRKSIVLSLISLAMVCAVPVLAANKLPGKGTKVQPARATWNTGFFQEALVRKGLEELGYKVKKPKDLANPIFYKTLALGDLDYWTNGWFPMHESQLPKKFYEKAGKHGYVVKSGDSFWKIAKAHKVKISELARWNNMAPKDSLRVGKKLAIWTGNKSGSSVTRKVNYTVRSGDSLARIASKFKVKVADLVRWNSLEKSQYIQPGQQLKLYVDMNKVRA